MKKDKAQSSFINIGSSSLLVVFLTLCLSTFAILSLAGANNDYKMSQRLARSKTDYYAAASQAEAVIAQLDGLFEEAARRDTPADTQIPDGQEIEGIPVTVETTGGHTTVSFQIPLRDSRTLQVQLGQADPQKDGLYSRIESWKVLPAGEWKGDQPLNLMPIGD